MSPSMVLIMTINEQLESLVKFLWHYVKKKLLKVFITNKNQDLKKAVLYGGGSITA